MAREASDSLSGNNGSGNSNLKPVVYAEGDYYSWTGTTPNDKSTISVAYERSVTDWDKTLRMNSISIGRDLQSIGDPMFYAGYGLTLTGVGAGAGAPLATAGGTISSLGTIMESAGQQNWNNVRVSLGRVGADIATKNLIKRIPHLNTTSKLILEQNASFKYNFIEDYINGN